MDGYIGTYLEPFSPTELCEPRLIDSLLASVLKRHLLGYVFVVSCQVRKLLNSVLAD